MAMTRPDGQLIAQVLLFSQGFRSAELIANKIVPFFKLCDEQLSKQPHYDFGLRALKSVLSTAGTLKRHATRGHDAPPDQISTLEQGLTIRSIKETLAPKLVSEDVGLLST
jgi:dynein heavy chain 1